MNSLLATAHPFLDAIVPLEAAAILPLGAEQDGKAEFILRCDRRVVFGADAAHFLETLSGFLSNPASIATEANDKAEPPSKGNVS